MKEKNINKDSWYKKMGERKPRNLEDEPVVSAMEFTDLILENKEKNMRDIISWCNGCEDANCEQCNPKECCGGNCTCK
jgi:hypothetical protein